MSLRAAKANARRAVNYNLAAPLPALIGETFQEACARGVAIRAAFVAKTTPPEPDLIPVEDTEVGANLMEIEHGP